MLTEHRTNNFIRAQKATQNVELMSEINLEGHEHRNSEANNSTVTILHSGADSGAILEVSVQLRMLANDESEAETDESEAKTEQAKVNKQLQIENNAASNQNQQSSRICYKLQWLLDSIHSAISNIKEPKTYSEAVGDPVYGKQ